MVGTMAQRDDSMGEGGFLSRWSQRKQALREGKPLAEPVVNPASVVGEKFKENQPPSHILPAQGAIDSVAKNASEEAPAPKQEPTPPAPTMRDVHELTPQSDFKPFMRADVAPDVKNAAMKQLFKDPHFNVMDMMDVYVDDYSKPDPLPPDMLRKMAVTQFLGFWEEEEKEAAAKKAREDAEQQTGENVAQSEPVVTEEKPATPEQRAIETSAEQTVEISAAIAQPKPNPNPHDHPDLQLQPDDAAGRKGALRSAG
jgi:hypothetical protein